MSNEIAISEIKRNRAAALAQDLMDGKYIAWLYVFRKEYWEFNYSGYKYPDAIRPAVDGRYQIRDVNPLARALVAATVTKENRMVYPGELLDSSGKPFIVQLNEVRFDENGGSRYVVDQNGDAEVATFSLAEFRLELVDAEDRPEPLTKNQQKPKPTSEPSDSWDGVRKDNCNIAILTYLQQCAATNQTPNPQLCWESAKENATDHNQNWMVFPKIRYPNKVTHKVYREKFDLRYKKMLENFTRSN